MNELCSQVCTFRAPTTRALPFVGIYTSMTRLPETQVLLQQLTTSREVLRARSSDASLPAKELHKLLAAHLVNLQTLLASLQSQREDTYNPPLSFRADLLDVQWTSCLAADDDTTFYAANELTFELAEVVINDALAFATFGASLVRAGGDVARPAGTAFRAAAGRLELCLAAGGIAESAACDGFGGAADADAAGGAASASLPRRLPPPELLPGMLRAVLEIVMAQADQMTLMKAVETGKSPSVVSKLSEGVAARYATAAREIESAGTVHEDSPPGYVRPDLLLRCRGLAAAYSAAAHIALARSLVEDVSIGRAIMSFRAALTALDSFDFGTFTYAHASATALAELGTIATIAAKLRAEAAAELAKNVKSNGLLMDAVPPGDSFLFYNIV